MERVEGVMKKALVCGLTAAILMGSVNVNAAECETTGQQESECEMIQQQESEYTDVEETDAIQMQTEAEEIFAAAAQNEKAADKVEAFVQRFYKNILGRNGSKEEMAGWVNNLKSRPGKRCDGRCRFYPESGI